MRVQLNFLKGLFRGSEYIEQKASQLSPHLVFLVGYRHGGQIKVVLTTIMVLLLPITIMILLLMSVKIQVMVSPIKVRFHTLFSKLQMCFRLLKIT